MASHDGSLSGEASPSQIRTYFEGEMKKLKAERDKQTKNIQNCFETDRKQLREKINSLYKELSSLHDKYSNLDELEKLSISDITFEFDRKVNLVTAQFLAALAVQSLNAVSLSMLHAISTSFFLWVE